MPVRSHNNIRRCAAIGAILCALLTSHPAQSAERLYCFSEICLGDPPRVIEAISLRDLSDIAEKRPRAMDLDTALPGITEDDRHRLAKRVDADGRFLVDAQTLHSFLSVALVCAPIAPFAAMFASASGHATAVEFGVIKSGEAVQFGVKTVTRVFTVEPGTVEYVTLVLDLSRKFGFRIDNLAPVQLPGGAVSTFKNNEHGFRLAFSLPDIADRETAMVTQHGCTPTTHVPID